MSQTPPTPPEPTGPEPSVPPTTPAPGSPEAPAAGVPTPGAPGHPVDPVAPPTPPAPPGPSTPGPSTPGGGEPEDAEGEVDRGGDGGPGGSHSDGGRDMARVYRRRRLLLGVGVVAVVGLLVGTALWLRGGRDDERSPEDTVRLFFDASMDRDCEELVDLVVERSWSQGGTVGRAEAVDQCTRDLASDVDFDAELLDVEVTAEEDDTAVVEVKYTLEGEDIDTRLDLEKEDDTWKIANT
ncbi:MAG TPA: hypothetical protein VIL36_01840 [Acidimicrobiales bacterium]